MPTEPAAATEARRSLLIEIESEIAMTTDNDTDGEMTAQDYMADVAYRLARQFDLIDDGSFWDTNPYPTATLVGWSGTMRKVELDGDTYLVNPSALPGSAARILEWETGEYANDLDTDQVAAIEALF